MYQGSPQHTANLTAARLKSIAARPDHKQRRISAYLAAPNRCAECQLPLTYEKRANQFCGRPCAAAVTNRNRVHSDATKAKLSAAVAAARANDTKVICAFCRCEYVPQNRKRKKYCSADCGRNAVSALMGTPEHRSILSAKGKVNVASQMAAGTWSGWAARNGPSYAESYVQQQLQEQGLSFDVEYPVGRFSIDIAFPRLNLAIEVDGKQHEAPGQRAHDVARDELLAVKGWTVLRIKWHSIKSPSGLAKVTTQIAGAVAEVRQRQACAG